MSGVPARASRIDPRLERLLGAGVERAVRRRVEEVAAIDELVRKTLRPRERGWRYRSAEERCKLRDELWTGLFVPQTFGVYLPGRRGYARLAGFARDTPYVSVLIISDASRADLAANGAIVRAQVGDVFSAFIPFDETVVHRLATDPSIRFIEMARPVLPTLDVATSAAKLPQLRVANPTLTGTGSIVGVIDYWIDYHHPALCRPPSAGGDWESRLVSLLDQNATAVAGARGAPPAPCAVGSCALTGVEYARADINAAIAAYRFGATGFQAYDLVPHGDPATIPDHMEPFESHGTAVAGCAAGNGLTLTSLGTIVQGPFAGVAPGADLIFASIAGHNEFAFGETVDVMHALCYVFDRAGSRPCVAVLANSDNQGAHDGSSALEQVIDSLLLTPGRGIVLSAGNANVATSASGNPLRMHAAGQVAQAGASTPLTLTYLRNAVNADAVEIWSESSDTFAVRVTPPPMPGAVPAPVLVEPGQSIPGTDVYDSVAASIAVQSVVNDGRNGDNCIAITFDAPANIGIPRGDWRIELIGRTIIDGGFHAWVDRNNMGYVTWGGAAAGVDSMTLGVPSTANAAITVANCRPDTSAAQIHPSSGRGLSRDLREKPELAAIGSDVDCPAKHTPHLNLPGRYESVTGTSFAAPLVAGACALLFQCRGAAATWADLRQALVDNADTSPLPAGVVHDRAFGYGLLDVNAACAPPPPQYDVSIDRSPGDDGSDPLVDEVVWLSPAIEMLPDPAESSAGPGASVFVDVTVRNRGREEMRGVVVEIFHRPPDTNLEIPTEIRRCGWRADGFYGFPEYEQERRRRYAIEGNVARIGYLQAGERLRVRFVWVRPNDGGDAAVLAIVRHPHDDPVGAEGRRRMATSIRACNNAAVRQEIRLCANDAERNGTAAFTITGSDGTDGLIVWTDASECEFALDFPAQALTWRDAALNAAASRSRPLLGTSGAADDPLSRMEREVRQDEVTALTDIQGASQLAIAGGSVRVGASRDIRRGTRLIVPRLRVVRGASFRVDLSAKPSGRDATIHVAHLSGGRRIGGISVHVGR
ncbi:MAG TPA: S8 family serine peptidase [Alphaproteobacteria bacterium]